MSKRTTPFFIFYTLISKTRNKHFARVASSIQMEKIDLLYTSSVLQPVAHNQTFPSKEPVDNSHSVVVNSSAKVDSAFQ